MMRGLVLVLAAGFATACAQGSTELGVLEASLVQNNGTTLNGRTLNGRTLNGRTLNGRTLNGRTLNGRTLNGVWLDSGVLSARSADGSTVSGAALEGAELQGMLDDGGEVTLVIEQVASHEDPAQAGLLVLTVSWQGQGEDEGGWVCGQSDDGTPVGALPLAGAWDYSEGTATGGARIDDPDAITFACEGAVLAKCVELGYRPWESVVERNGRRSHSLSLAAHHQACTRMLRADYCGDGASHTHDAVRIDVWDAVDVQARDRHVRWPFEAEWSEQGARCFDRGRLGEDDAEDYVAAACPDRWQGWDRNRRCGDARSDFYARNGFDAPIDERSLLMNETSIDE